MTTREQTDLLYGERAGAWHEYHDNRMQLAEALDAEGMFSTPADVIRFFEKPWKWTSEWEHLQANGSMEGYED